MAKATLTLVIDFVLKGNEKDNQDHLDVIEKLFGTDAESDELRGDLSSTLENFVWKNGHYENNGTVNGILQNVQGVISN